MKINERQRTYKNKDQKVLVVFILQISLLFWYLQNQPLHLLSTYFLFIALHIWENLDHNFVICSTRVPAPLSLVVVLNYQMSNVSHYDWIIYCINSIFGIFQDLDIWNKFSSNLWKIFLF